MNLCQAKTLYHEDQYAVLFINECSIWDTACDSMQQWSTEDDWWF